MYTVHGLSKNSLHILRHNQLHIKTKKKHSIIATISASHCKWWISLVYKQNYYTLHYAEKKLDINENAFYYISLFTANLRYLANCHKNIPDFSK